MRPLRVSTSAAGLFIAQVEGGGLGVLLFLHHNFRRSLFHGLHYGLLHGLGLGVDRVVGVDGGTDVGDELFGGGPFLLQGGQTWASKAASAAASGLGRSACSKKRLVVAPGSTSQRTGKNP